MGPRNGKNQGARSGGQRQKPDYFQRESENLGHSRPGEAHGRDPDKGRVSRPLPSSGRNDELRRLCPAASRRAADRAPATDTPAPQGGVKETGGVQRRPSDKRHHPGVASGLRRTLAEALRQQSRHHTQKYVRYPYALPEQWYPDFLTENL